MLCAAYANHDLAPSWRMIAFGYGQSSLLLMQCGTGNTASEISDEEAFIRVEVERPSRSWNIEVHGCMSPGLGAS